MLIGSPQKAPIVQQVVFELRYLYGYSCFDRCGRVVNAILRNWPEWILANTDASPQNVPLVNTNNECRFNFSTRKLDFGMQQGVGEISLSVEDLDEFAKQVEDLSQLVVTELDLTEFTRIGFRTWYLFECKNTAEAEKWLRALGLYQVSPNLESGFGGRIEATSMAVVIEAADRRFRVAFNSIERSIPLNLGDGLLNIPAHSLPRHQKEHLVEQIKLKKKLAHNPPFAAMIDIDAYQDDPRVVDPGDFVRSNLKEGLSLLSKSVEVGK